jgi:hypothetical protein
VTAQVEQQLRVELQDQPDLTLAELGQRLDETMCGSISRDSGSSSSGRPAAIISPPRGTQYRLDHLPLFVSQFPAATHAAERCIPERNQNATFNSQNGL